MKSLKLIASTLLLLFSHFFMHSQEKEKMKERMENKVDTLYTMDERSNIHLWIYNKVQKMNLSDEKEDAYFNIFYADLYKASRLNDKDQDFTPEERKIKFEKIISQMNSKLKEILTEEQYNYHIDYFSKLEKDIYKRSNWTWDKD